MCAARPCGISPAASWRGCGDLQRSFGVSGAAWDTSTVQSWPVTKLTEPWPTCYQVCCCSTSVPLIRWHITPGAAAASWSAWCEESHKAVHTASNWPIYGEAFERLSLDLRCSRSLMRRAPKAAPRPHNGYRTEVSGAAPEVHAFVKGRYRCCGACLNEPNVATTEDQPKFNDSSAHRSCDCKRIATYL